MLENYSEGIVVVELAVAGGDGCASSRSDGSSNRCDRRAKDLAMTREGACRVSDHLLVTAAAAELVAVVVVVEVALVGIGQGVVAHHELLWLGEVLERLLPHFM